ncbi:MAG: hypothetical protein J07HQW2_00283 [Haloquadratum walsbyi J07HQW2]|uniref:Uncharacterized protein n=1 Tax=Haloquadratum walsbyi J07HQW2 TaxID=1238425 RepID=U1MU78_9EURY|nr:MAG: hypothetical protein J07HQW2_00283 [Haloquadratum walsbyi J07HQW2]
MNLLLRISHVVWEFGIGKVCQLSVCHVGVSEDRSREVDTREIGGPEVRTRDIGVTEGSTQEVSIREVGVWLNITGRDFVAVGN